MKTEQIATYKEIAAQKKQERDSKFIKAWIVPERFLPDQNVKDVIRWPVESGYLTEEEIIITESTILKIAKKIKSKEWTSYQVTSAFCHRASIAHQLVNCLSEVFFEEGLAQARELDLYYRVTGKLKGPFHGIPLSLKDNLNVRGQATTLGIVGFAFNPAKFGTESELVTALRELGAVFCLKTNVPVGLLMPETINFIYGDTSNPFNRSLTSGGSSGGECALGALLGSCYLGVGSDTGGSLRIPASMQNLFALKPSSGRLSTYGSRSALPGLESVIGVNGPIATRLENLEFFCETLINEGLLWKRDPKCLEISWREVWLPEKLSFAILKDDGIVRPYPGILRAIDAVAEKLRLQGHEVIEWESVYHEELGNINMQFILSDGGIHCKKYLSSTGEPFFPFMKICEKAKEMGVSELWDLQAERTKLCKKFSDNWFNKITSTGRPIDALIMPASPYSGVQAGQFNYTGYTSLFNALDWPVGTFPVSRCNKNIDLPDPDYVPRNIRDKMTHKGYNAEEVHGGPISLQVVCRKLQEEKVVKLMGLISKTIGTYEFWKNEP